MNKKCQDCHELIPINATSCDCGWGRKKQFSKNENEIATWPNECQFVTADIKCRFPAVFSPSTRGGGPYYCRFHARPNGHLVDSLICKQSADFRPVTAQEAEAEFNSQVEDTLKKNDLTRREGESKENHINRMREFCRTGAAKIIEKGRTKNGTRM